MGRGSISNKKKPYEIVLRAAECCATCAHRGDIDEYNALILKCKKHFETYPAVWMFCDEYLYDGMHGGR